MAPSSTNSSASSAGLQQGTGSGEVFAHYLSQNDTWQPLSLESSQLFRHIVADDVDSVRVELPSRQLNSNVIVLCWDGSGKVEVRHRSLLAIAAQHGAVKTVSLLLDHGADAARTSPEGLSAIDFALSGGSPNAAAVLALLKESSNSNSSHTLSLTTSGGDDSSGSDSSRRSRSEDIGGGSGSGSATTSRGRSAPSALDAATAASIDPAAQDGGADGETFTNTADNQPYSTSELTRDEYSTDNFRMFSFKVLRCSKRYAHDWRACPFAHPTENARRRDAREAKYCSISCPDYKQGFCIRGDKCPYAHGVFEAWLHPSRYRTQLCKDGVNCHRPVCFFAHTLPELRTPTHTWVPTAEDLLRSTAAGTAAAAAGGGNGVGPLPAAAAGMTAAANLTSLASAGSSLSKAGGAGGEGLMGLARSSPEFDPSTGFVRMPEVRSLSDAALQANRNNSGGSPVRSVLPSVAHLPLSAAPAARAASANLLTAAGGGAKPRWGSPAVVAAPAANMERMGSSGTARGGDVAADGNNTPIVGFTAPRMSNAFARRHGLNPKDNPMLNLQKIALQSQNTPGAPVPAALPLGSPFSTNNLLDFPGSSGMMPTQPPTATYSGSGTRQRKAAYAHQHLLSGAGQGTHGNQHLPASALSAQAAAATAAAQVQAQQQLMHPAGAYPAYLSPQQVQMAVQALPAAPPASHFGGSYSFNGGNGGNLGNGVVGNGLSMYGGGGGGYNDMGLAAQLAALNLQHQVAMMQTQHLGAGLGLGNAAGGAAIASAGNTGGL